MAYFVRWELLGASELANKLYQLDNDVRRTIAAKALDTAAAVLVGPMRAAAPVGKTGNLRASIAKATRTYNTTAFGIVGPQYPQGAHGHLVERGSKDRYTKGKGKYKVPAYRGRMPANPFIARSYASNQAQVIATLESVLATEIAAATGGSP